MATDQDFVSLEETARALGVTIRHVRRLADAGELTRVARGLIDRDSLDRYRSEYRGRRTRSWAEPTAWGAIALLSGQEAPWLGATQASRVRQTLRTLTDPTELATRTRERAQVHIFRAHSAALPRLRRMLISAGLDRLGIVDAAGATQRDGYLAATELNAIVRSLGLVHDAGGSVTVRATSFDLGTVRDLALDSSVLAALDAATSVDPRVRGVGEQSLTAVLDDFR